MGAVLVVGCVRRVRAGPRPEAQWGWCAERLPGWCGVVLVWQSWLGLARN